MTSIVIQSSNRTTGKEKWPALSSKALTTFLYFLLSLTSNLDFNPLFVWLLFLNENRSIQHDSMFKPVNNHVQGCQQQCSSLSTTIFKHVNNNVQGGQQRCSSLSTTMFKAANNHVQACQQPCSRLSTTMFKAVNNHVQGCHQQCSSLSTTMLKSVNRQKQAVSFYV